LRAHSLRDEIGLSSRGGPTAPMASPAVTRAVDALPATEQAALLSQMRALAASDPAGARELLASQPALTAALLLMQERLGTLRTVPAAAAEGVKVAVAAVKRPGLYAASFAAPAPSATEVDGAPADAEMAITFVPADAVAAVVEGVAVDTPVPVLPPPAPAPQPPVDADTTGMLDAAIGMTEEQVAALDPETRAGVQLLRDAVTLSEAQIAACEPARRAQLLELRHQVLGVSAGM